MTKEKTDKLEEAVESLNKQFGKGTVISMSRSRAAEKVEAISTGSKAIDEITGIGGVPKGRIVEIYGTEAGGKSTLCLQIIAQAQAVGGRCCYIDIEQALDINYAAALGVNVDDLLVSQPDAGEDALDVAITMVQSGMISVVVVDSVAAIVPRAELEGDMSDQQMGLTARIMGKALRKLVHAVAATGTCCIFINQIRDKLGVMFGNPETTTGGKSLKFYASLRMDIRRISQIKKGDDIIGQNVKVKTIKNKLSAPYRTAEVALHYGKGFIE